MNFAFWEVYSLQIVVFNSPFQFHVTQCPLQHGFVISQWFTFLHKPHNFSDCEENILYYYFFNLNDFWALYYFPNDIFYLSRHMYLSCVYVLKGISFWSCGFEFLSVSLMQEEEVKDTSVYNSKKGNIFSVVVRLIVMSDL